jgi:hypothetical protein
MDMEQPSGIGSIQAYVIAAVLGVNVHIVRESYRLAILYRILM